jgi:hypothetical protein
MKYCEEPISLLLHNDGSLDNSDKDLIETTLSNQISFADPKETEVQTMDRLQGLPNCQSFRKKSLWGVEFFDPLFTDPTNPISFYIDADILFLRPFSGLFDSTKIQGGALFLQDTQWDAYCLRPRHLLGFGRRPIIVQGITTAIVCWDKRVIDWEYLEWFLGQFKFHSIPEWVMPTAQAGLASLCQSKVVSPTQLRNLYPNASIEKETFGVHLLGSYREEWLPKIDAYSEKITEPPLTIQAQFQPCLPRGVFAYATNLAKRWINTRHNRW